MRVFDFNTALVRAPGASVVHGLRSDTRGAAPSFEGVRREHSAYVDALRAAGLDVTVLESLEAFPDSVFVEDPALVFPEAAILLRPGAPSRRAEAGELAGALASRCARLLRLEDGFADGGDILVTPREVLIGLSARTDARGAAALQRLLQSIGRRSRVVAVPAGTLHLKTDCSLIDEDTVLATRPLAASGLFDGYRLLAVADEERAATNAVRVNDRILIKAGCPRTAELLTRQHLPVVPLEVSEIGRLDAGLSCMSLRWFDPTPRP